MKVRNMMSDKGNKVPNQFIITTKTKEGNKVKYFQSYETLIVKVIYNDLGSDVVETLLDKDYYNYSKTTSKYRHKFLLGIYNRPLYTNDYHGFIYTSLNEGEE